MVKEIRRLELPFHDGHCFGRVVRPDPRDSEYFLTRSIIRHGEKKGVPRKQRTWTRSRYRLNQHDLPACVGYSFASLFASSPIRQYIQPIGLYEVTKRFDEWRGEDYEGTSVRAGADVGKRLGLIREYRWARTLEMVIHALLNVGPVIFGLNWYEGMCNTDRNGFIKVEGQCIGGHAIHGFQINTIDRYVTLNQSWGDWGQDGTCKLRFTDLERLLAEQGECCIPIESQPETWFAENA